MRHDLLAGGDNRFASQQGGANVICSRFTAGHGFDDDVDVAGEEVVEALGPVDAGQRFRLTGTLVAGAPVSDVRESELRDGIGAGEAAGDGRADRAETEDADATTGIAFPGTVARRLERVQRHA